MGNPVQEDDEGDGYFYYEMAIGLDSPIDPLEIDYLEFPSQTVEPEATTPAVIEAQDADGDGVLTAALDLYTTAEVRQSPVCLTALTIDLETQQFAWHFTHPQLSLGMAALSEENASDILKDEVYTEASNALVEEFFQTSYLVLTDGTKLRIASGNVVGCDEDFWVMDNLASALRDLNETVPEVLSIDHLEINGVAYEFE